MQNWLAKALVQGGKLPASLAPATIWKNTGEITQESDIEKWWS
jgi:hypothetical protein